MRVVILAGGQGTRLGSLTETQPKPLVTVGQKPLVWHLLERFRRAEVYHAILAIGHLGERFLEHFGKEAPLDGRLWGARVKDPTSLPGMTIDLCHTGRTTQTGGRVKQVARHLLLDEPFFLTYGDGVADVDLEKLFAHHQRSKKPVTVTAVRPPARFGCLTFDEVGDVRGFDEKPMGSEGWINGGFMVVEPSVLDVIPGDGDDTVFEHVLTDLAARGQLAAYRHDGFWQCMDTPRDRAVLEEMWEASAGCPAWLATSVAACGPSEARARR